MDEETFKMLLNFVESDLKKEDYCMRKAIQPDEKLAVTLRFLATGETFKSLNYQSLLSDSFLSKAIPEMCDCIYANLKDSYLKDLLAEMMMKKESFENSFVIKNECEEIPAINIKKECSVSCDESKQDPSEPDPAAGGSEGIMSQEQSVKDEMFGDILIKEEIKEEDLEDEIPFPDHLEERLDSREDNDTSEPVGQNCLQEKMVYLPSIPEKDCSNSNSETPLFPRSGKLKKNLSSTEKEQIRTHTSKERVLAGQKPCSYLASNKGHLQPHERIHTSKKPFKCGSCPFQAARKGELKGHERTHTGERPFKCSFCSYQATLLGTLKNHERTHTGERPFKCSSCSYQAMTLGTLKNHERTHTGERPFKCSYCPYQATQLKALKNHERTHTGEKPFKCSSCSYRATLLWTLKNHERTHTGERPFKCSSCPYQAARIEHLKRHARIHTGERPFKCSSCPYQAARKGDLKTHVKMHTGERRFKCSSCSYQAMTLGSLKKHENSHIT